ncbi:MAG TPA: potassium-transporting ATPase subunit KdpC [Polyangiaceae bacterium]|jgi:K+-transporting ATPase ATPase C chain|nr:potassium-transporting ATPase subunit KdpC [Polyangiaceae bacterium]
MSQLRPCLVVTAALLFICCLVYPGVVTAGAQLLFKEQANGSLLLKDGKVVGSANIGQTVADWAAHPEYLWGRPSGASNDQATNITYSSGSNYGPMNGAYLDEVKARVAVLRKSGVTGAIPADLVTKSASGLDPHISPAAAELQVPRIARTRGLAENKVAELIANHTEGSTLGFLGEPRVNALLVNLDLDARAPYAAPKAASSGAPPESTPVSQK